MAPSLEQLRQAMAQRSAQKVAAHVSSRAAVALILREAGGGLELLLIRRAEHPRDPWSGQMAFPGGRSEPDDRDLEQTAVREVAEEIGLDLARSAEALGPLDEVRAMARLRPMDLTIQPFVFHLREPAQAHARSEVESVHWLDLDRLLAPSARSTHEYRHEGQLLRFPCLRVDGLVIWGLTHRMLMGLAERLHSAGGSPAP